MILQSDYEGWFMYNPLTKEINERKKPGAAAAQLHLNPLMA